MPVRRGRQFDERQAGYDRFCGGEGYAEMRAQQRRHCFWLATLLRNIGDLDRRARRLQILNTPAASAVGGGVEADDPKPGKRLPRAIEKAAIGTRRFGCLRARRQAHVQRSHRIDGGGPRDRARRGLRQGRRSEGSTLADAGKDRRAVIGVAADALDLSTETVLHGWYA